MVVIFCGGGSGLVVGGGASVVKGSSACGGWEGGSVKQFRCQAIITSW